MRLRPTGLDDKEEARRTLLDEIKDDFISGEFTAEKSIAVDQIDDLPD